MAVMWVGFVDRAIVPPPPVAVATQLPPVVMMSAEWLLYVTSGSVELEAMGSLCCLCLSQRHSLAVQRDGVTGGRQLPLNGLPTSTRFF